ncbi:MAG: hypothetical protein ACYSU0_00080, partial [Planctomycetota bacterium]
NPCPSLRSLHEVVSSSSLMAAPPATEEPQVLKRWIQPRSRRRHGNWRWVIPARRRMVCPI